ncbi:MAG: rhodanese-like domain-containing protein [Allobranchiibius sp.]
MSEGYAGDLTPQQAWALLTEHDDAMLVDVRTRAEWAYVGVPDTAALERPTELVEWVNFPEGAANTGFVNELQQTGLQRGDGRPLVFLCRSGVRSISAARAATAAGLGPAYNVLDGFEGGLDSDGHRGTTGWRAAGLPWKQS